MGEMTDLIIGSWDGDGIYDHSRPQRWAHGCVEFYETGWRSGYASKEEAIEAGKQWHEEDFLVAEYRDVTEDDITDGCDFVIFGEEFKVPHSIKENDKHRHADHEDSK